MIGKIVAFKPRSKGGGRQLDYLAGEAHDPAFTDYYSKDALGVWALGSGLRALGLSADGGFDPEATSRLAEGFHAETGERLARNAGADHRQGWDITIDDPKDFSLIHAFGSEAEKRDYYEARREAWLVVGSEIERLVRPKYAGHQGPVKIAMQVFEHDDSRSGDPHKHGHGFLFNVGVLPDGKACAIDAGPVMRAKAYLGQLYQSELARQFALRGHAVAFEERESTDAKTKTRYAVATIPGLATPEQLAGFSDRSADIAQALDAAGANKSARAKNAAALATRDEKKLTHAQMRTLWDEKARALGLDMHRFHAALGAEAMPAEKADIVKTRAVAEIEALSLQAIEGNGILAEHEVAFAAARALRGHSPAHIRAAAEALEKQLVPLGPDAGFGRQFTTRACIALEVRMVADFKAMAAAPSGHAIDPTALDRARAAWEAKTGHRLTAEQEAAARHIALGPGLLANIEGEAGTGKSTLMEVAAAAWASEGLRVLGAAPTGKAAEALAMSLGEADTCARLLLDLSSGRQKLDAKTVLVLDECGMLASPQYAKLARHAREAGAKLVCVGDRSQLAAIGMRGGFQAAIDAAGHASIAENRRQMRAVAVGGSIGKLFRQGKSAEALEMIEAQGRLTVAGNERDIARAVAERWVADASAPLEKMVLAELVETVADLNDAIRAARKAAGQLGAEFEAELTTKDGGTFRQALAVGDKILFLQNAGKDAGVRDLGTGRAARPKNGTAAVVESLRATSEGSLEVTATTEDGKRLRWQTADYATFALGYAHSFHKSQGSTAKNVYAVAEGSQVADLGLAYVGATRHKNDCHMFTTEDARARWTERAAIRADARMVSERLDAAGHAATVASRASAREEAAHSVPAIAEPAAAKPSPPSLLDALSMAAALGQRRQAERAAEEGRGKGKREAAPARPAGHAKVVDGAMRLGMELAKAAARGDAAEIARLAGLGVDLDQLFGGSAALHRAALAGRADCIKALAAAGASMAARNSSGGATALHIAAAKGQGEACAALIGEGASLAAIDDKGRKPAEHAAAMGFDKLSAALVEIEAEPARRKAAARTISTIPIPRPPRPGWELGPSR